LALASKCGTGVFPLEIFTALGRVLQMRCLRVSVLLAAFAMFLPWVISTSIAASGLVPEAANGSKKSVTAYIAVEPFKIVSVKI
jgi:hypothetical protein